MAVPAAGAGERVRSRYVRERSSARWRRCRWPWPRPGTRGWCEGPAVGAARAAQRHGLPYTLSTMATTTIEAVAEAAQPDLWFQLYILRDSGLTKELVDRAAAAGYRVLVVTVDTFVTGHRTRDRRNGLVIPPELTARTLASIAGKPASWHPNAAPPSHRLRQLRRAPGGDHRGHGRAVQPGHPPGTTSPSCGRAGWESWLRGPLRPATPRTPSRPEPTGYSFPTTAGASSTGGAAGGHDRRHPPDRRTRGVRAGRLRHPAWFGHRRSPSAWRGRLRHRARLPVRADGPASRGWTRRWTSWPNSSGGPCNYSAAFGRRTARPGPSCSFPGDLAMVSAGQLLGFSVASLVLIVIPGPGLLFVVGRALAHGRRSALATACRPCRGQLRGGGVRRRRAGTTLQRSATVFVVVKVLGARTWCGRHRRDTGPKSLAAAFAVVAEPREGWRALRDGVVVGMTNPKSYILFGAILPQFVNRARGDVPGQMLLLALVSVLSGRSPTAPGGSPRARCGTGSRARPGGSRSSAGRAAWP